MILGIVSIVLVVVITILVACNKIKERYYPYCIGIMALGLVYSTTMIGTYVVGSDIQGELEASRVVLKNGWNFVGTFASGGNATSVVTGFFAPWLSKLLSLDIVWVYKAILPLFLAGVPVVLYYAFRKQIGGKRAFFATLFFIIMPVYNLEIAQIAKSMVAELFFALMILAMASEWKLRYKAITISVCLVLTIVCHYTIGLAALTYLLGIIIVRLVTSRFKWKLFALNRTHIAVLSAIFLFCSGVFFAYYLSASGGMIGKQTLSIYSGFGIQASKGLDDVKTNISDFITTPETDTSNNLPSTSSLTPSPIPTKVTSGIQSFLYGHGHLVMTGLGLDFTEQPIEGRVFRITQYLTQVLIVAGALFLLIRPSRYKFTAEFTAGIGCSFILLLCCVFAPHFDSLINMSRFYHISLFFLAPMLVVGCESLSNFGRKYEKRKN